MYNFGGCILVGRGLRSKWKLEGISRTGIFIIEVSGPAFRSLHVKGMGWN